jgi:hypothetical protein
VSNPIEAISEITIPEYFLQEIPGRSAEENTIHIILEVIDSGEPELTSYRRIIIEVVNKQD